MGAKMESNQVVYVIDDDDGMRESMSFLLKKADIDCLAFSSGKQFLDEWDGTQPGCMVVDFQMPDMTGLALLNQARSRLGFIPFVLVTGHGTVAMAVEAMKMGAVTVIEKPFRHELFIETVLTTMAIDLQRRESEMHKLDVANRLKSLTEREQEIVKMVVEGSLTKQIAKQLGISAKTVEVHRSRITKKLGVKSVVQLVRMVVQSSSPML
ncbi:MAG: response regulator transcription factor [Pirellula sp.]|jgi:two-component system response regulator FixJ